MVRNATASFTLSLVLATTISALPQTARADYKTLSGASCMPYGTSTTSDDLKYVVGGVTTRNATHEFIICDFTVDAETPWRSLTNATLLLFFRAGDVDANVSCTGVVGSGYLSEGFLAYSDSRTIPARTNGTLALTSMTAPDSFVWSSFSVVCSLPAKATLFRMVLREGGTT